MQGLHENPILRRLEHSKRVLIAGAGGGFDVYAGLPLALALVASGREVFFANLTFSYLGGSDAALLTPSLAVVTPATQSGDEYFPERSLARWLHSQGLPSTVYAFEKTGVQPLRASYELLRRSLELDAIVLVDGGTDILMRGDEAGLGTPEEDMTSLGAVAGLDVPTRLVACLGFGIDAYHGVCHAHFLENVAALEREGGFLGAFSVPRASHEGAAYLDAVAEAQAESPSRPSIVNGSIAASILGDFGDVRFTKRTSGSELFINPLMSLYFGFELDAVARRSLYLASLEQTKTIWEVSAAIEAFRNAVTTRPRRSIPH